jgi:hypothetical protein
VCEEDKRQRYLRDVGAKVAPDSPEVAGPGNAARVHQQTRAYVQLNRKRDDQKNKQ